MVMKTLLIRIILSLLTHIKISITFANDFVSYCCITCVKVFFMTYNKLYDKLFTFEMFEVKYNYRNLIHKLLYKNTKIKLINLIFKKEN